MTHTRLSAERHGKLELSRGFGRIAFELLAVAERSASLQAIEGRSRLGDLAFQLVQQPEVTRDRGSRVDDAPRMRNFR